MQQARSYYNLNTALTGVRLWPGAGRAAEHAGHVHGIRGHAVVPCPRDHAQLSRLRQEQYVLHNAPSRNIIVNISHRSCRMGSVDTSFVFIVYVMLLLVPSTS